GGQQALVLRVPIEKPPVPFKIRNLFSGAPQNTSFSPQTRLSCSATDRPSRTSKSRKQGEQQNGFLQKLWCTTRGRRSILSEMRGGTGRYSGGRSGSRSQSCCRTGRRQPRHDQQCSWRTGVFFGTHRRDWFPGP